MNLRKFFNWPSKRQEEIILDECKRLRDEASKKAEITNRNTKEYDHKFNYTCKCKSKNVVNKIETEISSSTSYVGFFNAPVNNIKSSQVKISHCNDCQNEWNQSNSSYTYPDDVLNFDFFLHISWFMKGDVHGNEFVSELKRKGYHAESIHRLANEKTYSYIGYRHDMKLPKLRKIFKSVFDERN